jgi:tRNA threonylcarbamoyladenosine biosynthesis protein TsaB
LNILAIDTSTEACSAALLREDGELFSEFEIAPRQHTRLLPKMMDSVLASAQCSKSSISYCAFANGPGAFTGIRIAASTAQGIGIALNIPLIPISTLATLAQVSLDNLGGNSTLVALDARMGEVYWAVYRRDDYGLASLAGTENLDKINDVIIDKSIGYGAGHGWLVGRDVWQQEQSMVVDPELLPDAQALIKLARQAASNRQTCAADKVTINYLRNRVAEKPKKV